jgi:hypothetical protein
MEMTVLKKNKKIMHSSLLVASILSTQVNSQEAGFTAEVDSRLTYEDNILRAADDNAQGDTSLVVSPELTLAGILGKQRFKLSYTGEYANYFDNSDVNYSDHDIRLKADFDHSYRLTSAFDVQYKDKHEDFGDLNTIFTNLTEFNRYTDTQINGRVAYGRQDSFGQLVLKLGKSNRDYDNNNQEYRSNERDLVSLAFYYRIAPRTRLLAEVVYQDYSYSPDVGFLDLDNEYIRYLAGVEWALTNQLEGTVKVGYQNRDYRLDTLRDIDGLSYEANVDWKPNTYTTIGIVAKRESIDSSLESAGGFLRTTYGVNIKHGFTELTKLDAGLGYSKDELVFGANRQDTRNYAKVGVLHQLLTWVELGANLSYEDRDSTQELANYQVSSVNITAKISFD